MNDIFYNSAIGNFLDLNLSLYNLFKINLGQ